MSEQPQDAVEGNFEVSVASSEEAGEPRRYLVTVKRLSAVDTRTMRSEDILDLLTQPQTSQLLEESGGERFIRVQPRGGAEEPDEGPDVTDVLAMLDEADQDIQEATAHRQATRDSIDAIRKEVERRQPR